MTWFGFPQAIRVSVGTARENIKFLRAMADLLTVPAQAASRQAARRVQKRRPRK
jgi:hypothetical protein